MTDYLRARVGALLEDGLHRGLFTGATVAVRTPTDLFELSAGQYAADDPTPVTNSSLFDLASLTKTFTGCAISLLIADGVIDPDAPVTEVMKVGAGRAAEAITLRMLLTHTSGLPTGCFIWRRATHPRPDQVSLVIGAELESAPGSAFRYSCSGYIAAGVVVAATTGMRIDQLIQERVLDPLRLDATSFGPVPTAQALATEDESYLDRGIVRGSVHDELAWYLGSRVGNAGLFAPVGDVFRFAEELRSRKRFATEAHELMSRSSLATSRPHASFGHGLGPRIGDRSFMVDEHCFGHTGFTGTMWTVDPRRQTSAVLLTNRVHSDRSRVDLTAFRLAFNGLVAASS